MSEQSRIIFITDIHQCLDEFFELLKTIQYKKDKDRLILCGDYLDRGPYSPVETIRKIRELDLPLKDVLIGNHEYRFVKWYKHLNRIYEGKVYYKDFSEDDINFLCKMPTYVKVNDNWVAFHAGIRPGTPIDKQKAEDLIYLRYADGNGKKLGIKKVLKGEVDDVHFWTEQGPFGFNAVYGHTVHSKNKPRIDRFTDETMCVGLDTGCAFGGHLSALILKDDNTTEIVSVKAKRVYYKGYGEGGN